MGRRSMRSGLAFLVTLALLVSGLAGLVNAAPATADAAAQTSLRIVKYAADGTTIVNQTTIDIATMAATLPVQGDGTTHYYTEGPTFDPNNLWDPTEICPGDSLKDKGALKGTNLKDLCDLVGGATHGYTIKVEAADGYGDTFDYDNIYNPVGRQGAMVICWWNNGEYSGPDAWTDGFLLAFFTTVPRASDGKLIFGHQDMHDCLPERNWHYYYDNSIQYPSTNGVYTKWVSTISIYASGTTGWSIPVSGNRSDTVTQGWFDDGVACGHGVSFTDLSNNVWEGMPLWYLCGLVDDYDIHGPGAFNDTLASAGYEVKITSADGSSCTLQSATVARSSSIILADKLSDAALPDDSYPLKLVGSGLTSDQMIGRITKIEILNAQPVITATAGANGSIAPSGDIVVSAGASRTFTVTANTGYHIAGVLVDGVSVGKPDSYVFSNVTSCHTIAASFVINPRWDVNGDRVCNICDVVRVGLWWGQTGTPGWIPEDVLQDGNINASDVAVIRLSWGQTW
ncbi:MAG: hypothetical protein NTU41_02405 [Chloroflexi bacterium]|nr:hypothetical protein [Chloroflexota bacterium]